VKLNQVIAITNGKKSQAQNALTKIYQTLDKKDLFSGVDRTYRAKNEDGDQKPPEKKIVQTTVIKAIKGAVEACSDMINFVATLDIGNCSAKADIKIDGKVLAKDVPATHLIFLEKQVLNMINFIAKFPILDAAEEWSWNPSTGCYTSEVRKSSSTAKVLGHKVIYEATKEHIAQVETFTIDEIVGEWSTILLSGNISADAKEKLHKKAVILSDAIKTAREEANMVQATESDIGNSIMNYLFGDIE